MKKAAQIPPLVERVRSELKQRLAEYNQYLKDATKALGEKEKIPELKAAYKEAEKTANEARKIEEKAIDLEYEAEEDLRDVEYRINDAKREIPKLKAKIKETTELLSALKEN